MQIVIDIDENVFTRLFDNGTEDYAIMDDDLFAIAKSIRNCTPLPKGHGRLIDEKDLSLMTVHMIDGMFVCDAPTIIEADKEESEK